MSTDDTKKWGTIFLDASRESSLSKLDAMQAASRQEQWNQKAQQDYLEKVRQKAIDRAREILGEAYTERLSVLEEAEREAERIREDARAAYTTAEEVRNQAQEVRHEAQGELDSATHIRNSAHEEGFQAGIAAAQEELTHFRMAMGSSVAGVLQAITAQSMYIFNDWRSELVELVKVCVEKGTNVVLSEKHTAVLEAMLLRAVRNLDERRSVTLRVNPDDESVVADLFNAAKEKNPDLAPWRISTDPALEPGDIVAESLTGTVDSRRELYHSMVKNIIEYLSLPESQSESDALQRVHTILEEEIQKVMELTPVMPEPEPEPEPDPNAEPAPLPESTAPIFDPATAHIPEMNPSMTPEHAKLASEPLPNQEFMSHDFPPQITDPMTDAHMDTPHDTSSLQFDASDPLAPTDFTPPASASAPARVSFDHVETVQGMPVSIEEFEKQKQLAEKKHMESLLGLEPSRQELEEELLPVETALPTAHMQESAEEIPEVEDITTHISDLDNVTVDDLGIDDLDGETNGSLNTDMPNPLDEQGLPISAFEKEDFDSETFFEQSHEAYSPLKDKA